MSEYCLLNGAIVPTDQARIPVTDRGFLFGDGLFETMRVRDGRIHLLERHLRRLGDGLDVLRIERPDMARTVEGVRELLEVNRCGSECVVRLTVSRGSGGGVCDTSRVGTPTVLATIRPRVGASMDGEGAFELMSVDTRVVRPPIGHRLKSLSYVTSILAGLELPRREAVEALMLTPDGYVAEGAVTNVFIARNGVLETPPLLFGVLDGVARTRVIELAAEAGIDAVESEFVLEDLAGADECFITNAARGVVPVCRLDGEPIGSIGPITTALWKSFEAEVATERDEQLGSGTG